MYFMNFIDSIHSCVFDRLNETKNSSVPASPPPDLRYLSDDKAAVNVSFRQVVGSLMWSAAQTRPDIAYAIRTVARFPYDPKKVPWKVACKNSENLYSTAHLGPTYRKGDTTSIEIIFNLDFYEVDADYGQKVNDRRPVSGSAIFCGESLVTCFLRTQKKSVTSSTTEAEYVAMAKGVEETMNVGGILTLLIPQACCQNIVVHEDSEAAKALTENSLSSSHSKHIDVL